MNTAYDINPEYIGTKEKFKQPESVVSQSFCGISGLALSKACQNAGFERTDLFNKDIFTPKQPDNSFVSSTNVRVNGRSYKVLPSTPTEFVEMNGFGLNQVFIDRMLGKLGGDASKLIPSYSGSGVSSSVPYPADSVAPESV